MTLKDILGKIKKMNELPEKEDLPDDMTRDKYLRSLRRQRRVQMEEIEKEHLKKQISEFEKQRTRNNLFGMNKENNILRPQGKFMEKYKKEKFLFKNKKPKKAKNILKSDFRLL